VVLGPEGADHPAHLGLAGELGHVHEHVGGVEQVGGAEPVPGVDHRVVADAHRGPGGPEGVDPGVAATARIAVVAALEHDVVEGVGDHLHPARRDQLDHLGGVGVGVGVHGGAVTGDDPTLEAAIHRLGADHLQVAGAGVVGLVAVEVDPQAVALGELEGEPHAGPALLGGALEVGDGADRVAAELHRLLPGLAAPGRPQDTLLGEGDHLQLNSLGGQGRLEVE
jgi:hypothetical protein